MLPTDHERNARASSVIGFLTILSEYKLPRCGAVASVSPEKTKIKSCASENQK
jgi:hypothetical protein